MLRQLFTLCLVLSTVMLLPALALAAEAPPPTAVDFTPIVDYFVYAALSAATVGVAWLVRLVSKWAGVRVDDAMAERIRTGIANGLRAGYEKHKGTLLGSRIAPEIRRQIIADAARYAIRHFPDATRHFGVEKPEQLADLAAALLPKIEAERTSMLTPAGRAVP